MNDSGELYIKVYDVLNKEVKQMELEELIKELVAATMPLTFHIESLKSQAVIMRTNIMRQMKIYGGKGVGKGIGADISTDYYPYLMPLESYKDVWGKDYLNNLELLNRVIEETEAQVIFLQDKLIEARYHPVCGGSTENSENVDGNIVNYLRKVLCNYCKEAVYYKDYKDIAIDEIEKKLGVRFTKTLPIKNMAIEDMFDNIMRDEEGRVVKLSIAGKEFSGKEVMELLELNSTRFSWRPEKIRFYTRGKGDGLGLCLYGSNEMACRGKNYDEIIKYYYTGVSIEKIEKVSINCPLKGKDIVIDPGHGGDNCSDYRSSAGHREKDICLDICNLLKERLEGLGAKVYMTRSEDVNVPLSERAYYANKIQPQFFLTIHQNYYSEPSISGTEIYYYRGDSEAMLLGRKIMEQINNRVGLINRGVRSADFYLLRDVKVSSLHIELGYLSNENDLKLLTDDMTKKDLAESIAKGLLSYYL